jgi:hypothetical protein
MLRLRGTEEAITQQSLSSAGEKNQGPAEGVPYEQRNSEKYSFPFRSWVGSMITGLHMEHQRSANLDYPGFVTKAN